MADTVGQPCIIFEGVSYLEEMVLCREEKSVLFSEISSVAILIPIVLWK
jgi:hypothetical protein